MMLTITVDRGLDDPVYEQVAQQVRQFVASGALEPGTTLRRTIETEPRCLNAVTRNRPNSCFP